MANTYEKIASVTVGSGGATDIEFTSIGSDWDDLAILFSLRADTAVVDQQGYIRFNGDTGNNYSANLLYGNGSSDVAASQSNQNTLYYCAWMNGASATASTFSNNFVYIPNYRSSTNKSISADNVVENNATTGFVFLTAGLWANSAAITSIKIYPSSGNLVQHSTAVLYGIKKS